MGDIPHTARAAGPPRPSGSGEGSWQEHDAGEIRRLRAKAQLVAERMKSEIETRTRPVQEITHELLARAPRRTESEMRDLLESELSRYRTLQHGWDGECAKPALPDR